MLILLSSNVSLRYYEFTIGYCNNDNVDKDIESLNTSMGGEQARDDSSNTNNCRPKNKSETETKFSFIANADSTSSLEPEMKHRWQSGLASIRVLG